MNSLTGKPSIRIGRTATRATLLALSLAALLAAGRAQAEHGGRPTRWISGELLVGLRAGVSPGGRHSLFLKHEANVVEDVGQSIRIVRIRVPVARQDAIMARLQRRPEVRFVEKNFEFTPALTPNDPEYGGQWHLPKINAEAAWDLTQGDANAVIAILDSGVDATQPDFASKLVTGYNTYGNNTDTSDAYGHGTQTAGVAGAATNNVVGIAGVAGGSPIMPVRVTNASGAATSASIANGIIWATDHGARIVNISFNGVAGNTTIRTAAEYAVNHGTLVVAASGNCACTDPTAETPFILSVSATDEYDALAYYSSTGPFVDISAPGNNILTTDRYGLYFPYSGTSLASPVVAGVAALMFSAKPSLTPTLAAQILESSAVDLGAGGYDPSYGYGRVDALAAVNLAINYTPPPDTTAPTVALISPVNGATISATTIIDVTTNDNVGVVNVDLYVDGAFFVSDTTSPYSFALDTTTLPNGSHTLSVTAYDAAGNNAGTTPLAVTVSNAPPDTTAPVVSIDAPAASATVSGIVTVAASATDNVAVVTTSLYIDGALSATDTTAPYAFSWSTTTATDGAHTLDFVAADAAGNSTHAQRSVTVSNNTQHAPLAGNDVYTAPYRTRSSYAARVFAVLANDSDADNNLNSASVKIGSSPNKGGTVRVNTSGTVSYTPKRGYRGVETFTYTVNDLLGAVSNMATVTVTLQ